MQRDMAFWIPSFIAFIALAYFFSYSAAVAFSAGIFLGFILHYIIKIKTYSLLPYRKSRLLIYGILLICLTFLLQLNNIFALPVQQTPALLLACALGINVAALFHRSDENGIVAIAGGVIATIAMSSILGYYVFWSHTAWRIPLWLSVGGVVGLSISIFGITEGKDFKARAIKTLLVASLSSLICSYWAMVMLRVSPSFYYGLGIGVASGLLIAISLLSLQSRMVSYLVAGLPLFLGPVGAYALFMRSLSENDIVLGSYGLFMSSLGLLMMAMAFEAKTSKPFVFPGILTLILAGMLALSHQNTLGTLLQTRPAVFASLSTLIAFIIWTVSCAMFIRRVMARTGNKR